MLLLNLKLYWHLKNHSMEVFLWVRELVSWLGTVFLGLLELREVCFLWEMNLISGTLMFLASMFEIFELY